MKPIKIALTLIIIIHIVFIFLFYPLYFNPHQVEKKLLKHRLVKSVNADYCDDDSLFDFKIDITLKNDDVIRLTWVTVTLKFFDKLKYSGIEKINDMEFVSYGEGGFSEVLYINYLKTLTGLKLNTVFDVLDNYEIIYDKACNLDVLPYKYVMSEYFYKKTDSEIIQEHPSVYHKDNSIICSMFRTK